MITLRTLHYITITYMVLEGRTGHKGKGQVPPHIANAHTDDKAWQTHKKTYFYHYHYYYCNVTVTVMLLLDH
jgi:hypothetical protein